jgi:hypothetical protein
MWLMVIIFPRYCYQSLPGQMCLKLMGYQPICSAWHRFHHSKGISNVQPRVKGDFGICIYYVTCTSSGTDIQNFNKIHYGLLDLQITRRRKGTLLSHPWDEIDELM